MIETTNNTIPEPTPTGNPYNYESVDWSTPDNHDIYNAIHEKARRDIAIRVIDEGVELSTLDSIIRKTVAQILEERGDFK